MYYTDVGTTAMGQAARAAMEAYIESSSKAGKSSVPAVGDNADARDVGSLKPVHSLSN